MSVASSGSTDPVKELDALRELRGLLLDLCETPASRVVSPPVLGSPPHRQGLRTRAASPVRDPRTPEIKSVLASLSTLGAALERVGEADGDSRSWRALETLQDVVEQWLGVAPSVPGTAPAPPPGREAAVPACATQEREASSYYQQAQDDLRRLGSLKALPNLASFGWREPGEADSLDPAGTHAEG